jgi:hypothetical protein
MICKTGISMGKKEQMPQKPVSIVNNLPDSQQLHMYKAGLQNLITFSHSLSWSKINDGTVDRCKFTFTANMYDVRQDQNPLHH